MDVLDFGNVTVSVLSSMNGFNVMFVVYVELWRQDLPQANEIIVLFVYVSSPVKRLF